MTNLKNFIVRTCLENADENQKTGNPKFNTKDYFFIENHNEMEKATEYKNGIYASDYAVMNGANQCYGFSRVPKETDRPTTLCWLRSANQYSADIIGYNGSYAIERTYKNNVSICPAMNLDVQSIISAKGLSECFRIEPVIDESGKILYHTIEFGSFPQDKAKNSDELENLFNTNGLTKTGKKYIGGMKEDGNIEQNEEYEYCGKRYVRVISKRNTTLNKYKDNSKAPESGTPVWAEVKPIKWRILNDNNLPEELIPGGDGTAKTIYVKSEEAIISGIPFYPNYDFNVHGTMWQNTLIRALLNGYDLHEEISVNNNGNNGCLFETNYSFKENSFISQIDDSNAVSLNIQEEGLDLM